MVVLHLQYLCSEQENEYTYKPQDSEERQAKGNTHRTSVKVDPVMVGMLRSTVFGILDLPEKQLQTLDKCSSIQETSVANLQQTLHGFKEMLGPKDSL